MAGLEDAVRRAREDGWAIADFSIEDAAAEVEERGFEVVPTRRGSPNVAVLRPIESARAHPRSLSGIYGGGALPLHTDGAQRTVPPSVTILSASEPSATPTLLLEASPEAIPPSTWDAMRHGVFAILGRYNFVTTARDEDGRVRLDEGCMRPQDAVAREVCRWFRAEGINRATHHVWSVRSQILVIDNERALHGRPDATRTPERELTRLMVRWPR